jgi:hypothetical protein
MVLEPFYSVRHLAVRCVDALRSPRFSSSGGGRAQQGCAGAHTRGLDRRAAGSGTGEPGPPAHRTRRPGDQARARHARDVPAVAGRIAQAYSNGPSSYAHDIHE